MQVKDLLESGVMEHTDNLNIVDFKPLATPEQVKKELPIDDSASYTVFYARKVIQRILSGADSRKIIIAGPCSLYDEKASMDYASRLVKLKEQVKDKLEIVMRTYFEKPRTTIGWKGMLYDPHIDESGDIELGLKMSRKLMLEINKMGLPTATEILDPIIPQYLSDLVSWAAIGARTTESQIHRQMASGLSMPIGFKNGTDGNLTVAIDAIKSARSPHHFLGIDSNGKVILAETRGNKFGHLVMRGGTTGPNYSQEFVAFAEVLLKKAEISNGIIIDCSHANSSKDHKRQRIVLESITNQIKNGGSPIAGIMLESFINEGAQKTDKPENLEYGISLTDKCIGWDETEELILGFADALV